MVYLLPVLYLWYVYSLDKTKESRVVFLVGLLCILGLHLPTGMYLQTYARSEWLIFIDFDWHTLVDLVISSMRCGCCLLILNLYEMTVKKLKAGTYT